MDSNPSVNPYEASQVRSDNFIQGESEEIQKARIAARNTTILLPLYFLAFCTLNGLFITLVSADFPLISIPIANAALCFAFIGGIIANKKMSSTAKAVNSLIILAIPTCAILGLFYLLSKVRWCGC